MAKPFLHINLSEEAQFFRPVALEPGCPLFDPTNANDRILFRWFGGMTPEPEWDENGQILRFFIRNDQGGRLEDVTCTTVTNEDLNEKLITEIERLQARFERIRATSTTEKILREKLSEEFRDLIENKKRPDRTYYFFKYQDGGGLTRLVWIPGYAPIHQEYGAPMICDDEACNQLYVRLPGAKARCPICLKVPTARRKAIEAARRKRNRYLLLCFLLLLCGWILWNQFTLKVKPGPWNTYVGCASDFRVITPGLDGFGLILSKDVTDEVFKTVENPSVACFPEGGMRAYAVSPGETKMRFYSGWRFGGVKVTVHPPVNPNRVWIEPENITLAVGSTQRVKLMGEYEGGQTAELSQSTYWDSRNDGTVYHFNGFVEGLQPGETNLSAKYRATPKDAWMDASATVSVASKTLESLEVKAVHAGPLPVGKKSRIEVLGKTAEGEEYAFTGSSRLEAVIDPPSLATYQGETIQTLQAGTGRLQATLTDGTPEGAALQTAEMVLDIEDVATTARLRVYPKEASIAVDELFPLSVVCGDVSALKITSANPKVVRVGKDHCLIGRSAGTTEITVEDGTGSVVIPVTVANVKADGLVMVPPSGAVPVDHDTTFRFFARAGSERYYPLAPGVVKTDAVPNGRYALADGLKARVRGLNPTDAADPQSVTFSYQGQKAKTSVKVIPAPLRLKITPSGKVALPLGLCMTFDGFAVYGDGVSTLVPYTRMEWNTEPAAAEVAGFGFEKGKAMALDVGAGPVSIWGNYFGTESNRAELTTTERTDVTLGIEVDRTLRVAGEPGTAILTGKTVHGDVELVPNVGKFSTSQADVVAVTGENSGSYKAVAAGAASLSATHPAAEQPASVDLRVVHPRNARLYWEPSEVNVAVGEIAPFQLMLEGTNPDAAEGEETEWSVPMDSPGVYYSFGKPDAVLWRSPTLSGIQPAEAFDVSASYLPYLKNPAHAKVSVFGANPPQALRVVPSEVSLAPGQAMSFAVEEQLEGAEGFTEVQPDDVKWEVPRNVYWRGPMGQIRPQVEIPADEAAGSFTLRAKYRGKTADVTVTAAPSTLNPADPEVELLVRRYPAGRLLPVGQAQSYSIWMKKGEVEEPAPNVRWTPDFENEYLTWSAPVMEATKAGLTQWITAKVGDRAVRFFTQTMDPFVPGEVPPPREGDPSAVRILSNSGTEVSMAVGAKYVDYRVEAEYPDGFIRVVTKDANLHPIAGDKSIVSPSNGELTAVKPGKVTFIAEYMGVDSEEPPLTLNVTESVDVDELRLEPDKDIRMLPNETVTFRLHGYKEKKSVGLLTGMGNIVWKSDNEAVATTQGPVTTSVALGKANITAELNGVVSKPAAVDVVATIDEKLGPTDNVIKMLVGESKLVGKDFALIRGNVDFSMQCGVTPLVPGICEYDATRHALVGKAPGATDVIFTMADKKAVMRVIVGGVDAQTLTMLKEDGEIIVEPAAASISAGQAIELRVYAVSKDRTVRLERTASAVFRSSDPSVCEVRGLQLCGLKPGGPVEITVMIPEITGKGRSGKASLTVDNHPITELVVEPGAIRMSTGDKSNLFIQGRSASGLLPLFAQSRLKVATDGPAARMNGIQSVEAAAAGDCNVNIDWDGKLQRSVAVKVDDNPYTSLAIDPVSTTLAVGEGRAYQVTALRGGRLYVLQPETGLQLTTADPNVAVVQGNMVFGKSVGRTTVVARFAGLVSEGTIDVVEPGAVPTSVEAAYVDPNAAVTYRTGDTVLDGGYRGVVSTDVFGDGVAPYAVTDYAVTGVSGLRFEPASMRLSRSSGPVAVRVFEEMSNGTLGREVSNDPNLKVESASSVVQISRAENGPYMIQPAGKDGTARVSATLGDKTALPMFVQVGEVSAAGAVLSALPGTLEMSVGNTAVLDSVRVIPDAGMMPFDIAYRLTPTDGGGVVSVEGTTIRATAPGTTRLQVTSVDPQGVYDNMTTFVPVTVTKPLQLTLSPMESSLRVGDRTAPFVLMARDETGASFPVSAAFTSTDPSILQQDAMDPSRFQAVSLGSAQVRASYGGQELYANVSVAGDRYLNVEGSLSERDSDFTVMLTVTAGSSQGALEYRIYEMGSNPPDAWVPGTPGADGLTVMLSSPAIRYRGRNDQYTLVIESRTAGGTDIQKYPYNFRLGAMIKKVD
ncbi:MAG: hypothetical protein Q4D98_00505 [Planctomycetia bacterium]|nr:hypothetical protein [Planctomycetia bacterium]